MAFLRFPHGTSIDSCTVDEWPFETHGVVPGRDPHVASKKRTPKPAKQASRQKKTARAGTAHSNTSEDADAAVAGEAEVEGEESEDAEANLDDLDGEAILAAVVDEPEPEIDEKPSRALIKASSSDGRLARLDPLQQYMREVGRHPLLSPEEEKELAVHYEKTGDVDAAARLVTANLRLVVKIAYEYRRAYRNMMDLVQEGNIGLMQAVKKYDPYRGVKLSSYAAWWIRAYMLRFILNNARLVKLGTTQAQRKLFFNLNKEKARLSALGIEPSHAEIAERLDVSEKEVVEMDKRLAAGDASLDTPVNEADGRQTARVDLLPGGEAGPDTATEGAELSVLVRAHLDLFRDTLKDKELVIFDERLAAEDPKTLQQLGDQFGVSRERVRQLEARLTGKLRDYLRENLGDAVEVAS